MPDAHLIHHDLHERTLSQLLEKIAWPSECTCATQESDGLIIFWDAPVEVVISAVEQHGHKDLVPIIGGQHVIHAQACDPLHPIIASDWLTAVVTGPNVISSTFHSKTEFHRETNTHCHTN